MCATQRPFPLSPEEAEIPPRSCSCWPSPLLESTLGHCLGGLASLNSEMLGTLFVGAGPRVVSVEGLTCPAALYLRSGVLSLCGPPICSFVVTFVDASNFFSQPRRQIRNVCRSEHFFLRYPHTPVVLSERGGWFIEIPVRGDVVLFIAQS